jgi:hypothetical protein
MTERKVNPNDVVVYRKKNPCLSGSEIGRHFGITRQRTNQILKGKGVQTTSTKWGKGTTCPDCGKAKGYSSVTCNKCSRKRHQIPVACSLPGCDKVFMRNQSQVLYCIEKRGQEKFFCSKKHKGQYLGENYGFAKHPENMSRSGGTPKVDQENIIDLFKAGYKQIEISDLTGVKYPTVHYTLFKSELGKKENFPKVKG